jgi:hypothetical protein
MLDDAERLVGPQSDSARIVATTIRQRMRCGRIAPDLTKEVRDA